MFHSRRHVLKNLHCRLDQGLSPIRARSTKACPPIVSWHDNIPAELHTYQHHICVIGRCALIAGYSRPAVECHDRTGILPYETLVASWRLMSAMHWRQAAVAGHTWSSAPTREASLKSTLKLEDGFKSHAIRSDYVRPNFYRAESMDQRVKADMEELTHAHSAMPVY